jgi:toxin HigB-1
MEIIIKHPGLSLWIYDKPMLIKQIGVTCAKKLNIRLDDLRAARSMEDLRFAPGKYHLSDVKQGEFTCVLDDSANLLFRSNQLPILKARDGDHLWNAVVSVSIMSIQSR